MFVRYLIWEEGGDKTKLEKLFNNETMEQGWMYQQWSPYQSTFQKEIENLTNMELPSSDSVIGSRGEAVSIIRDEFSGLIG